MESRSENHDDRRQFPRLRANCRIRVRKLTGTRPPTEGLEAVTVNISGGGLCFKSDVAVEPGEFLAVELALPEFPAPVVALARAAFCGPGGGGYEVGIEFWWVGWGDDSAQRAIADYIKTELG